MKNRKDILDAKRGRSLSLIGTYREVRLLHRHLFPDETVYDLIPANTGKTGGRALLVATNMRVLSVKEGWLFNDSETLHYSNMRGVDIKNGLFFAEMIFHSEGLDDFHVTHAGRFNARKFVQTVREKVAEHKKRSYSNYAGNQPTPAEALPPQNTLSQAPQAPYSPPQGQVKPSSAGGFKAPQIRQEKGGFVGFDTSQLGTTPSPAPAVSAFTAELVHLAQLREQNVLTEEEFQQAKQKLLNG